MPRSSELPNLSPARLDLDVYRGDTLALRVQLRGHGKPMNLSAVGNNQWTFNAQVKDRVDGDVLGLFVVEVIAPARGLLRLQMETVLSKTLPSVSVWDLQSQDPAGRIRTLLRGRINATADVTIVSGVVPSSARGDR